MSSPTFVKCPKCGEIDFFRTTEEVVNVVIKDNGTATDDYVSSGQEESYQCKECGTFLTIHEIDKQVQAHEAKHTKEPKLTMPQEEQIHEHRQGRS